MKDKVNELRTLLSDLDTLIYILSGGFKNVTWGNGTVKEQIACYKTLGTDIQSLITEILEENGDDINSSRD